MRFLMNALFLVPNRVGGSETYARGVLGALAAHDSTNEYTVCLGEEAASTFPIANERWRIVRSPFGSHGRALRLILEQLWVPSVAAKIGAELVHSLGYTGPVASNQARITSIHDMNYKRHPEDLTALERLAYATLIPPVARSSHRIAALSVASREDIVRFTGVAAAKVAVIPGAPRTGWPGNPANDAARVAASGIVEPFVLSVAASYPHKNLERLVAAFPDERVGGRRVGLVIVGLRGRAEPGLARMIHGRAEIKRVGWVDEELLGTLYRRALFLAFPTLYEGFGLPILESMALGTPVLTSDYGAMAEVAGDAAERVDPRRVDAIEHGLRTLIRSEHRRAELRELGFQRARQFSWARSAELTRALYAQVTAAGTAHRG